MARTPFFQKIEQRRLAAGRSPSGRKQPQPDHRPTKHRWQEVDWSRVAEILQGLADRGELNPRLVADLRLLVDAAAEGRLEEPSHVRE